MPPPHNNVRAPEDRSSSVSGRWLSEWFFALAVKNKKVLRLLDLFLHFYGKPFGRHFLWKSLCHTFPLVARLNSPQRRQFLYGNTRYELGVSSYHWGSPRSASRLFERYLELREELAPSVPIPQTVLEKLAALPNFDPALPIRILPYIWVSQIGHIAHLDAYLKVEKLGLRAPGNAVLLAPPHKVVNPAFLDLWRPHIVVVEDDGLAWELSHYQHLYGDHFYAIPVNDGRVVHCLDAGAEACVEWDRKGFPPLVSLPDSLRRRGAEGLARLGLPSGAWFVCLHVREGTYYQDSLEQDHRNAALESYLPAIAAIRNAGGWVVRMGDPGMRPFPAAEGVIDYAHSPERSDWMDVFLCGAARFFVGMASGLSFVPISLGRPCLLANWTSNCSQPWTNQVLFLPKLLYSDREHRLLSLAESVAEPVRAKLIDGRLLRRESLCLIDNTPEELADAVGEMLEWTEPGAFPNAGPGVTAYHRTMEAFPPVYGNALPSPSFFNRHAAHLF